MLKVKLRQYKTKTLLAIQKELAVSLPSYVFFFRPRPILSSLSLLTLLLSFQFEMTELNA